MLRQWGGPRATVSENKDTFWCHLRVQNDIIRGSFWYHLGLPFLANIWAISIMICVIPSGAIS
eukprot:12425359-Karenia_brevis.AAC.1